MSYDSATSGPKFCSLNCTTVSNGEIVFCYCNTCSENEGDCDAHDECQDGLVCGSNNCPTSNGFDSEVDCCYHNDNQCYDTCYKESWKGDGSCDDYNNNCGCEWDGGDCCGNDVNIDWCSDCQCLDPNANSGTDSSTTSASTNGCEFSSFINDDNCDDEANNENCEWDGGDCCGDNVKTLFCVV